MAKRNNPVIRAAKACKGKKGNKWNICKKKFLKKYSG